MIYRILAFIAVYVSLPLAWVSLGLFLALAPARCGRFIDENVISLPRGGRPGFWGKLAARAAGLALIAFAGRFVLNLAALLQ